MALYGVIADIHGNREALLAVLAALAERGVSKLLCLGDIVGYNADPDECVALLRSRHALSIAGNHDLIALRRLDFARCSNKARYALKRTRRLLSPESATYLDALPAHRVIDERVLLVHGGVRDVEQYMVSTSTDPRERGLSRRAISRRRGCASSAIATSRRSTRYTRAKFATLPLAAEMVLREDRVYFVNPGSVDASRKRAHKHAEFAVLDTDAWRRGVRARAYDCASTEAKAAVFGYRLNPWLDRLYTLQRRLASISGRRRRRAGYGGV